MFKGKNVWTKLNKMYQTTTTLPPKKPQTKKKLETSFQGYENSTA